MKNILKIEEIAMFLLSIFLFLQLDYSGWWFAALILTPDLSMLGYLINPKVGAYTYNFTHLKGVAVAVAALGIYTGNSVLQAAGIILFGHTSMDRIFGYGLKYSDSFNNTHLGRIGKSK